MESENSDAVVVVVSEENRTNFCCGNGVLVRDFTRFRLNEYLHEAVIPKPVDSKKKLPVRKGFRSKGDGKK